MKFKHPEKVGYLQECCNKFGDFKVCTRRSDGTWSKHFSVLECWHNLATEGWRLDEANNRTAFWCETIIDLDPKPTETADELKARAINIFKELIECGSRFKVYFSGSKGYHIHLIDPDMNAELKNLFAAKRGADVQVVGRGHMIALENCPHWKTGNMKKEVEL